MRERGKHPKRREGLSESCVENYARRQHQIWRWIWSQIDRFVAKPSHDQADMFVEAIASDMILRHDGQEYASTSKPNSTTSSGSGSSTVTTSTVPSSGNRQSSSPTTIP